MKILGLKKGIVKLVPHHKKWANFFVQEKFLLERNLKGTYFKIEHAGSTAVPSIMAKPIIDLWVGVKSIKDFSKVFPGLKKSGYQQIRTTKAPLVHFVFAKGTESKGTTHYLHLVKYNGKIWKDSIAFRDLLKSNKANAKKYSTLKLELSRKYPNNRILYIKGKTDFILNSLKEKK